MTSIEGLSVEERKKLAADFLKEMYFLRRQSLFKWSKITGQTPFIETKFLGQNLVSLVTDVRGSGTAARGTDLIDGCEVKTCSRVDQLSRCVCGQVVSAIQDACPSCGNTNIKRMTDSHWIFSINTNEKLGTLLNKTPRVYLVLIDKDSDKILARFRIWFIEPTKNALFQKYVKEYYQEYFIEKREKGKNPAPMNLHPLMPKTNKLGLQLIFEATVSPTGGVSIEKFSSPPKLSIRSVRKKVVGKQAKLL